MLPQTLWSFHEVGARAGDFDVILAAAAVADYAPVPAAQKLKKEAGTPQISFTTTDDILAELGRRKRPGQTLVGFAAETEDLLPAARRKLTAKNLDWIVANDVTQAGAGFDGDTNIVTLLGAAGEELPLPLLTKREVAEKILDAVRPA